MKTEVIRLNPSVALSQTGIEEALRILGELNGDTERYLIVSRENRKLAEYLVGGTNFEAIPIISVIAEEDFWAVQNSRDSVIGFESDADA